MMDAIRSHDKSDGRGLGVGEPAVLERRGHTSDNELGVASGCKPGTVRQSDSGLSLLVCSSKGRVCTLARRDWHC
jgi:hypothetical protein